MMSYHGGKNYHEWVVKLLNKVTYQISVRPEDNWLTIKEKIKDKTNVPVIKQHLFVGGTRIVDENSLKINDAKSGAKIIQLVKEVELLWYFSKHSMWDDFNVLVRSSTAEELCEAAVVSYHGGTPLHFCCDRGAPADILDPLLNAFPKACEARNRFGSTPLHWAAFNSGSSVDLLRTLANTDHSTLTTKDEKGDTPLLEALKCGNFANDVAAIEILAGHNAASIRDKNGKSPSDWANEKRVQKDILGLLLSLESITSISAKASVLDLSEGCYPQDTYSFLSKYGPLENIECFSFGFAVYLFQMTFLMLMVLNIVHPTYNSSDSGDGSHDFIPGDVETPVKIAQYLAVLAFLFFADLAIYDVMTAIDMLPLLSEKKPEDKIGSLCVSSLFRFSQGALAVVVSFLLIFTGPDVKEIVLNFTAVNFISSLDNAAFELAVKGHYGTKLRRAALDLEGEELPDCVRQKNFDVFRKNLVLSLMLFSMVGVGGYYTFNQTRGIYLTDQFRVQFNEGSGLESYSGCYTVRKSSKTVNANRLIYELYDNNNVSFGYCKKRNEWVLFDNSKELDNDACKAVDSSDKHLKSYSSNSISFDIKETFGNTWFSEGGSPLDLTFYEDDGEWTEAECDASFGDGECFDGFNTIDYDFDGGDCCGATCHLFGCGSRALHQAFGVNLTEPGDGYPNCVNPDMVNITIRINSIAIKETIAINAAEKRTTPPLLTVECGERTYIMVNLQEDMKGKNENVSISDGANCIITTRSEVIKDYKNYYIDGSTEEVSSAVNYEIYQLEGVKPMIILSGTNQGNSMDNFQLVPKCYFTKLSDHVDLATLYGKNTSQANAIYWLMTDETIHSNCEMPNFLERYALTVMHFDVNTDNRKGWIETNSQCNWDPVTCSGGHINKLYIAEDGMKGTIATEIGLFKKLSYFGSENIFTGTIPTELGQLRQLIHLELYGKANKLNGTLPTELYQLERLEHLHLDITNITGNLPTEFCQLKQLEYLYLVTNSLTGTLPTELGRLNQLRHLFLENNNFKSTLPSELGQLERSSYISFRNNSITGNLPTELGQLKQLEYLDLNTNSLTGTLPTELGRLNQLRHLSLCGNKLTGTLPTELGRLEKLESLWFGGNDFVGTLPDELCRLTKSKLKSHDLHLLGLNGLCSKDDQLNSLGND